MNETLEAVFVNGSQQNPNGSLPEKEPLNDVEKVPSMRERLRDPKYRSKLKRSWLIAGAFFNMGLTAGMTGVTLLDLQIITGADLERASAFVTGFTGGYMTGCLVGGVIFSYLDVNFLLFLTSAGMGASLIVTPYCSNYILMVFMRVVSGFFAGGINTTGNAGHMGIWGNDGKSLLQIIHFCFAVGGLISPLYTEPFLAKRVSINETDITNYTTGANATILQTGDPTETNVHFAFLISGLIVFLGSLSFLYLFVKSLRKDKRDRRVSMVDTDVQRELPLSLYICLLIMLCSIFTFYSALEVSFLAFLIPFLVKEYDFVTKATGVYITVIFWISFVVSRFAMIFISKMISAVSLMFLCLALMFVAFIGFAISAIYGAIPALCVFTAFAGLGNSGFYAAGYGWAESELMKVTARVASCICVMSSTGTIVFPLLAAYLMENVNNMWFCYILVCLCISIFVSFVSLLLLNKLNVNKRYKSLDQLRKAAHLEGKAQALVADQKM